MYLTVSKQYLLKIIVNFTFLWVIESADVYTIYIIVIYVDVSDMKVELILENNLEMRFKTVTAKMLS